MTVSQSVSTAHGIQPSGELCGQGRVVCLSEQGCFSSGQRYESDGMGCVSARAGFCAAVAGCVFSGQAGLSIFYRAEMCV